MFLWTIELVGLGKSFRGILHFHSVKFRKFIQYDFNFSFRDIFGFESVRFQNPQIKRLVDDSSQFIIATHSPMIMAFPGACLLELTSEGIEEVDYWATEHFCVMREFLNAPEKVFGELFEA